MKIESTLSKFSRVVDLLNGYLETIGVCMLFIVLIINIADIIGSKVFRYPFPGIVEVVGFFHAIAIAFGIGITHIVRQHIRMEIVVDRLPKHVRPILDSIVALFLLVLCITISWQVIKLGLSFKAVGEISGTLHLPVHYFAYLVAFGFIGICLAVLREFLVSLHKKQNLK